MAPRGVRPRQTIRLVLDNAGDLVVYPVASMAHPQPLSEPKSPMWLPALGAALFVLVSAVWLVTPAFVRADVSPVVDAGVVATDGAAPDSAPAPQLQGAAHH